MRRIKSNDIVLCCYYNIIHVGANPEQEEPSSNEFTKVSLSAVPDDEAEKKHLYEKVRLILHTCNVNEYRAVLERMTPLEGQQSVLKYKDLHINFRLGKFADYTVSLVYTEQCKGAKNPLIVALDTFPKAEAIIGVGIGFGVDPDSIKLADIMVSTYVTDASMLEIKPDSVKARYGEGQCKVDQSLLQHFNDIDVQDDWQFEVSNKSRHSKVNTGTLVSSANLIKDESFKQKLLDHIYKPIGGEMEGSVLLEIFHDHEMKKRNPKPSVIVIKGVADYGDEAKTREWQPIAAKAAVDYVHYCLKEIKGKDRFYSVS